MHSHPVVIEDIATRARCQMIDVTDRVRAAVARLGVREGFVVVQSPHTTAGVTINENADPDVQHDLLAKLDRLAPRDESFYRHGEGNSDSHLKTSMVGVSVTLLVQEGQLMLGTWQGVYLCEFDGPRRRTLWIKAFTVEAQARRKPEVV